MPTAIAPLLLVLALAGPALAQSGWRLETAWSVPVADVRGAGVAEWSVVGDAVLVVDGAHGVTALDARTGALRWFMQLDGPPTAAPGGGGDRVTLTTGLRVHVLDAATGRRVRAVEVLGVPAAASVARGEVLFVPTLQQGRVRVFNLASGIERWSMRVPGSLAGPLQLAGASERPLVLVATRDGTLRALPATLGAPRRERWVARTGSLVAPPIVAGSRTLAVGRFGVHALETDSGSTMWTLRPGRLQGDTVAVTDSAVVVAAEGRLRAVSLARGVDLWSRETDAVPVLGFGAFALVRRGDEQLVLDAEGRPVLSGLDGRRDAAGDLLLTTRGGRLVAERLVRR